MRSCFVNPGVNKNPHGESSCEGGLFWDGASVGSLGPLGEKSPPGGPGLSEDMLWDLGPPRGNTQRLTV